MLGIKEGDPLEIFTDGERIVLRKYVPGCCLCGNVDQKLATLSSGKIVCGPCVDLIRETKLFK